MTYFLYLPGHLGGDAEAVRRLETAAGISVSDARMLLHSKFPRRVAAHATPDDATAAAAMLQAQGFPAFVVSRDEAMSCPTLVTARSAEFGDSVVSWRHDLRKNEVAAELGEILDRCVLQRSEQVLAVFRGCVRWSTRSESTTTRTGSIGPVRIHESRAGDVSLEGDREQVLLVKGGGYDSFIVVRERHFDFACLGKDRAYGPGANLGRLHARLRALSPSAHHDESLMQFSGDMGFAFQTAGTGARGPGVTESTVSRHSSTFDSLIQMARLLALQHGLG